jgi:carbonic anhydrase
MTKLTPLIERNRAWSARVRAQDAQFFERLSQLQTPKYLWIGCSDSRVPANQIIDMAPGEVFVHRNVANVVVHADLNCLSAMQFAVDVLKVEDIMVVGHYGCGGVRAAMGEPRHGLIDHWLRSVKDTELYFAHALVGLGDDERFRRLVELNVVEQVYNLGKTSIVQNAWKRRRRPWIHGWVFDLATGYIRPQTGMINDDGAMQAICKFQGAAVAA